MAGPGRNQREAMERLIRLLLCLSRAPRLGVSADELVAQGAYGEADPRTQLARDLRHLRAQGWQIDNLHDKGADARYVLVSGDNRLRLSLTPDQLAALRRAALVADRDDLVERLGLPEEGRPDDVRLGVGAGPPELGAAIDAVNQARLLRFTYRGKPRVAHPGAVRHQNAQWYLSAVEDDDASGTFKHFVIGRMSQVSADAPGTARRLPSARLELHPLSWQVDPSVSVVLRTEAAFVPDVERSLGAADEITEHADGVDLTYAITNRAALRSRVYSLGTRVRVLSPDDVREEIVAELRDMAGL